MPIDMRDGIQVGPIDADFYGVPGRNFAGLGIGFVQENGGLSQPRPQYFRLSQQRPRTIVQGHTGYQLQPQQVRSGRITNGIRFGEFRFPFRRPLLPQTGFIRIRCAAIIQIRTTHIWPLFSTWANSR